MTRTTAQTADYRLERRDYMRLRAPARRGEQPMGRPPRDRYPNGTVAGVYWCPGCRQDALAHAETGRCLWDDTLLEHPQDDDEEEVAAA